MEAKGGRGGRGHETVEAGPQNRRGPALPVLVPWWQNREGGTMDGTPGVSLVGCQSPSARSSLRYVPQTKPLNEQTLDYED